MCSAWGGQFGGVGGIWGVEQLGMGLGVGMGLWMGCHMAWGLSMFVLCLTNMFVCVCAVVGIDTELAHPDVPESCKQRQMGT
jgi:hypothetical protein